MLPFYVSMKFLYRYYILEGGEKKKKNSKQVINTEHIQIFIFYLFILVLNSRVADMLICRMSETVYLSCILEKAHSLFV